MIARVRVLASRPLTPTMHAITVEKPPGFTFRPVQFCGLEIDTEEGPQEYSMSLACSPTRDHLEFGARLSDSPWKQAFRALRPGDEVEIDGPYGHFVLDEQQDAVFVAGGIGITPLKGMAEFMADTGWRRRAALLYSNRTQDDIAYRDELESLRDSTDRFRVLHTLTREPSTSAWSGVRGRIDAAMLRKAGEGLDEPVWYVCGGPALVANVLETLQGLGVPMQRLVYEAFYGYA